MLLAGALRGRRAGNPEARGLSLRHEKGEKLSLRDVTKSDLEVLFEQQKDPEANSMAAFPPRDRDTYMAHSDKVLRDPTVVMKTIVVDGKVAGSVATFLRIEKREVGYWLGREFWGRGIATRAVAELVNIIKERPLFARVAKRNPASRRVVEKCGFAVVAEDAYTDRKGELVEEHILRLD